MLSFKWTVLFFLWLISNVAAIPRITTQDIEIFVGAVGTVGFASVLGWHLLRNQKKTEEQLVAIVRSHEDGISVTHPTLSLAPTATLAASEAPSIVETFVSKSSPDVISQPMCPSTVPMTRFFAVEGWSNGTLIHVEEIVGLWVGDLNDRYSTSSVAANNDTFIPEERLDRDRPQASDVFTGMNDFETRPSARNVFPPSWNLSSIFVNAHADRKMRPVIEFARKKFFMVRDFLNEAAAIFLRLVPTHPVKAAFILVGVPLMTKFGPATARKVLVLLSLYAPVALLYLHDIFLSLHDILYRYIEGDEERKEDPEPIIETAAEPLPVDEVVPAPDSATVAPVVATFATSVTPSLTETPKDDEVPLLTLDIESEQQGGLKACIEDKEDESLPQQTVDAGETLPPSESLEHSPSTSHREDYTASGIHRPRPRRYLSILSDRPELRHKYQRPQPFSRDLLHSRLERPATVTSIQESRELLPEKAPEEQVEAPSLRLSDVPSARPDQPQPVRLVARESEDAGASESENAPSPQLSLSVLPASKDIGVSDPLSSHEQRVPAVHDSENTPTEGEGITAPLESVVSPAFVPIPLTPTEDDKKDEDNEPHEQGRRRESLPQRSTVEGNEDEDEIPNVSGPSTGILEAIKEEEPGLKEDRDKSLQAGEVPLSLSQLDTVVTEERLQELTESPAERTDSASGGADDSIDINIADFGGLFDSETPVSTPSKPPVVNQLGGTSGRRLGGLRRQTGAAEMTTSRSERNRGVAFATESDGSVVGHTRHFRTEEAPVELQQSMVVDAQGAAATGVPVSAEQSIPEIPASSGEQQQFNVVAEGSTAGYQEQEQSLGASGIDSAFLRSLQSFSFMPAEYQAQFLAESAQRTAAFPPASNQAGPDLMEVTEDASDPEPMEFEQGTAAFPPAGNQAGPDLMQVTEAAAETDPMEFEPHQESIDDFLSATMGGLSLGEGDVDMEYEHDGPAHQVPSAQEAFQMPPSPVQPPGYEPAIPTDMDIEQHGSAAPEQFDLLTFQMPPAAMQEEFMLPEDLGALLEFNSGATTEIPQAGSNESAEQSTYQPPATEEHPLQSLLPGLSIHQEVDLEVERREKPTVVQPAQDEHDPPIAKEFGYIPNQDRATRYKGSGRRILPVKSVFVRSDKFDQDAFLGQDPLSSMPVQPAVNPFANLTYTAAPVNPGNQAFQSGTQPQDRPDEMDQNPPHAAPSGEGDTQCQEETVSQYPPLEDDVIESTTMSQESEDIAQGDGDPLDNEFEAAQRAYRRQQAIAEEGRRAEEAGENQDSTSSCSSTGANTEYSEVEDEDSDEEEESEEEGGENPWDDSEEEDHDEYGGGYGGDDGGGAAGDGEYGHGDSGGSHQEQGLMDFEFDGHIDDNEGKGAELSEDDNKSRSNIRPGEEDKFPCRERMWDELNRLAKFVKPYDTEVLPPRVIFVDRKRRDYAPASVAESIPWCNTPDGREWLWDNWDAIRKEHGWDMIHRCQDIIEAEEQQLDEW